MSTKYIIFLTTLLLSTILGLSSSSWLVAWCMMEINLMCIIPLITNNGKFSSSSSSMNYFLAQSLASVALLLIASYSFANESPQSIVSTSELITLTLAINLGIPPFHLWTPPIIELLSLTKAIIILSWQNIIPMFLILFNPSYFVWPLIAWSGIVGCLGGLNQNNINNILLYSSISHLMWLVLSLHLNELIWAVYFLVYTTTLYIIVNAIAPFNIISINKMSQHNIINSHNSSIFLNFLSIGGMPPLVGFIPKILTLEAFSYTESTPSIFFILLSSSLLTMFFYFNIIYISAIGQNTILKPFIICPEKLSPPMSLIIIIMSLSGPVLWTIF